MGFKYFTINEGGESKLNVERSIFLGKSFYVDKKSKIKEFVDGERKKNLKANHVAWGAVIFENEEILELFSDDGEPSNSAGAPILREIKRKNLKNTLVTVVRYFGGKKLGKRGLIDAYSKCAYMAIDNSKLKEVIPVGKFEIQFSYENFGEISYEVNKNHGVIKNIDYEKMRIQIEIPEDLEKIFITSIKNRFQKIEFKKI